MRPGERESGREGTAAKARIGTRRKRVLGRYGSQSAGRPWHQQVLVGRGTCSDSVKGTRGSFLPCRGPAAAAAVAWLGQRRTAGRPVVCVRADSAHLCAGVCARGRRRCECSGLRADINAMPTQFMIRQRCIYCTGGSRGRRRQSKCECTCTPADSDSVRHCARHIIILNYTILHSKMLHGAV